MLSLSTSPPLNFIPLSPPISPQKFHPFINGTSLSFKFPAKPLLFAKTHNSNPTFSANNTVAEQQQQQQQQQVEEEYQVISATRSEYNNIVILQSQTSKVLLLDDSGNVHSILYNDTNWTNSYWDEFTSLPAIIPNGPVAVFGLGGGTVAHQLLEFWPSLIIDGWELDEVLIDRARMHFGISELEVAADESRSGVLRVCIGDALSPSAAVEGGYAGIVVDLFANAEVLPELQKAQTWLEMQQKLMPDGRIMVNCGGEDRVSSVVEREYDVNLTVKAMCEAFGAQSVNWKKMPENLSGNYLAFTGPFPDLDMWSESVPEKLRFAVKQWRPCDSC